MLNLKMKGLANKRNTFRALLLALTIGSFSSAFSHNKEELPETISKDTYDSIFSLNDDFPDTDIIDLDDSNSLDSQSINSTDNKQIDLSINKKNLKLVNKLSIDALKCDFNDLLLMPNLEELQIINFPKLSDNDKDIINSLPNLKNIKLYSDYKYLNIHEELDLSWLDTSIDVSLFGPLYAPNDLDDLYLYKIYDNLDEETKKRVKFNAFSDEKLEELKKWDKELTDIVNSFGFTDDTTNEEKIIRIISYVTDRIDYDPEVSNLLKNSTEVVNDEKMIQYNDNLLESIFDDDDKYGICCNYAALTEVLGYYSNMELSYITGTCGEAVNNGHAWCSYYNNGELDIIDPTFLDSNLIFNIQKENLQFCNEKGIEDDDIYEQFILDEIFTSPSDYTYDSYKPHYDEDDKNDEDLKTVKYINEDSHLYNSEYFFKPIAIESFIGFTAMLMLYADITISVYKNSESRLNNQIKTLKKK